MVFLKRGALVLLALLLIFSVTFIYLLGPKDAGSTDKKEIKIVAGMSRASIAQTLSSEGLIKSQFAFFVYSKLVKGVIIPGTYELSAGDSASTILEQLNKGKFKVFRITIKEGWWASDIEAELIEQKGLKQMVGFADAAKQYEGYLFPDTYEFKIDETIEGVIERLRDNFELRTKELRVDPDVVILASIIEREAKGPSDRAAIAGVYVNRLKKGMRLEADATIQYAKGSSKSIVTVDDYRNVISPYNTYLNDGLPPGPIANPGLESIKAVLNPETHDYFYYFHAKGETIFSKTYEEHRAKVKQYF